MLPDLTVAISYRRAISSDVIQVFFISHSVLNHPGSHVCRCIPWCVRLSVFVGERVYMSGPSRISQEIAGVGLFAFRAQLAAAVRRLF